METDWAARLAAQARAAGELLQPSVDALGRLPLVAGWTLIALGALLLVFGRQGQRVLLAAGVSLGAALVLRHFALRLPGPDNWLPLASGALAGVFVRPFRAALLGAGGFALGAWLGQQLAVPPIASALIVGALVGALAWVNERPSQLFLPPIGAALSVAAGASRIWRRDLHGLAEGTVVLLCALGLLALFIPLALERDALMSRRDKRLAEAAEAAKVEAEKAERRERMAAYLNRGG